MEFGQISYWASPAKYPAKVAGFRGRLKEVCALVAVLGLSSFKRQPYGYAADFKNILGIKELLI